VTARRLLQDPADPYDRDPPPASPESEKIRVAPPRDGLMMSPAFPPRDRPDDGLDEETDESSARPPLDPAARD
jgi:hypothetical protein